MTTSESPTAEQAAALETIVSALLGAGTHSEEKLIATLENYRPVAAPGLTDDECRQLIRRLISRLNIDVDRGVAITSEDFEPWLDRKKRALTWDRWLNYKQWMLRSKRPPRVIDRMDELTDRILDLVGDPSVPGSWARRGLVLGDVQSGKTASYLALFNKAADAGFRLIIVLAGHTESLRQQTQERVDEGFIGRDSSLNGKRAGTVVSSDRFIGIGQLSRNLATAMGMTTVARDFRKSSREATNFSVTSDSPNPYVFVVKKNKSVLLALAQWLNEQPKSSGKLDIPLLLLDDESDYASVNTNDGDDPTAINEAIRGILEQFSRSSYVAFTATPFANIFIDHENTNDLFPRDFIYSLESPSNYVGSVQTFGTPDSINTTTVIDLEDADDHFPLKHRSTHNVHSLPESLHDAIRAFFLANAVRDLRGDAGPRSMLINVSRYKRVQGQVFDLVDIEVTALRNVIELYSVMHASGDANTDISELERVFSEIYADVEFEWDEVLASLRSSVADIRVQIFNSDKDRKLEEDEVTWVRPPRLIAVGGDVLSRGLTLEGLVTSYFYRRTQASDTLMQMARWFGYRDGYADLCRVWIDPTVASDFRFIAESVDELRYDLRSMHSQKLTPKDFGLAVRKHPGALLVTAKNKMKSAEVREKTISLIDRRIETTRLLSDRISVDQNYAAFVKLLSTLQSCVPGDDQSERGYPRWRKVPKVVVADFLDEFRTHPSDAIFSQSAISKFVRGSGSSLLRLWDVVVINGTGSKEDVSGVSFIPPTRSVIIGPEGELRIGGKSGRLAGADDLQNVLERDRIDEIARQFHEENPDKSMPETVYYRHLVRPALLVYALRIRGEISYGSDERSLVVAIKLAFPGSRIDVANSDVDVRYVVNSVAKQTWFSEYTGDEIDLDA